MKFRYDKQSEELVVTEATRTEYHQLDLWLTRHVKGYRFMPAFKMGVWNGQQTYFKNGKINLGLWKEALKGCQEIGSPFFMENKIDFPINRDVTLEKVQEFCKEFFKFHKVRTKSGEWIQFMPYDHQIESAYKILKNRYCMAEVATSGGKSLIISIVMFYTLKHIQPDAKILIIVPSITLVTQFYDNIIEYNWGINTLTEMREKKIDSVLNPDAKYSPCEHAYCRFGVSGTFPDDDSCEILTIQSVLGPKITEVSANELKEKGIITPMDIKVVLMNHDDIDFDSRIKEIRKGGYGKEAFEIEKDYIHISDKRLEFIKKIVEKCDTNTLLLFHTIDYGQTIFNKLSKEIKDKDFFYIDGEISGKKREEIKKQMDSTEGNVKVLVASYGTLSTGVSINAIFNVIFADSFKSEQIIIQSIGRALRLHSDKKKANIFDLVDVYNSENFNNILFRHFKEREKFYIKRSYPYK